MRVEEDDSLDRQIVSEDVRGNNKPEPSRPRRRWLVAALAVAAAAVVYISGVLPRVKARDTVRKETELMAVPTVSVVQPKRSAPVQEIVLPANVQPYISSPIYARTNGYLKRWYADIGTHVKKGRTSCCAGHRVI